MNLNLNGKAPGKDTEDRHCHKPTPMMILNEVSHLMQDRIRSNHDELFAQRSVRLLIMELARKDGRTQLDLVNATHLKAPTVSVAMQKLEKLGIVTRKTDEYDQRATRVFLTEKGREADNRTRKAVHDAEEIAMAHLSEEERDTLAKLLLKIREDLIEDRVQNVNGKDGNDFE